MGEFNFIMKYLLIILTTLLTLNTISEDTNTYSATLPEIIVVGDILENYVPQRTNSEKEFIELNKPLFQYIAKYTWLTEAQAFAFLRIEQGNGSSLFIQHNNPFNVKGNGVVMTTWETHKSNVVQSSFKSYKTLREGLNHFIHLMNTRYHSKPLNNKDHAKWLYNKGYFTDKKYYIRAILADRYYNYNV